MMTNAYRTPLFYARTTLGGVPSTAVSRPISICFYHVSGGRRRIGVFHMRVRVVVRAEDAPGPARGHAEERDRAQRPAAGPGAGPAAGMGAQQGPDRPARGVFLRGTRVQRVVHVRAARQIHRE